MEHNEGINKLYGGILTLVLAAILLGIGMTVLGQLGNASRIDVAFVNNQINATNSSCVTLTNNHITTSTADMALRKRYESSNAAASYSGNEAIS